MVISGDRGGQCVGPSLPIHPFGNAASKNRRTCEPQRRGAPSCWKILETDLSNGKKIYICIPRSFTVINVCNEGKTLCPPCTSFPPYVLVLGDALSIHTGHVSCSLQSTLSTNLTVLNYPCVFFIRSVSRNVAAFVCGNCVHLVISGMLADFWLDVVVVMLMRVSGAAIELKIDA